MLKHYIKIAWRNFIKNKLLSFIKIFALSVGIATFILGISYVQHEKSFDTFNKNFDRIYRVQIVNKKDKSNIDTQTPIPLSTYIKENVPEVEISISIREVWGQVLSASPELTFYEEDGYYVNNDFFDMFTVDFLHGDKKSVLDETNSIVLSKSLAEKFFKSTDVVGKTILNENKQELLVTGVYNDFPTTSHIEPTYFLPAHHYLKHAKNNWGNFSHKGYVLLKQGALASTVNSKIKNVLDTKKEYNKEFVFLQPLAKLHLNPDNSGELATVLYLTFIIVLIILILSALNYMNLSTAYSTLRSKEIGVRKVSGGRKGNLRIQYLLESTSYALFSFFLALIIAKLALNSFNSIVDREISLYYFSNPKLFLLVFLVTISTGVIAGIYPAFVLSSFKPALILKGNNPFQRSKGSARGLKGMVCFQFMLSAILIASSVWIYRQVNYMKNKDIGFDKTNLLQCFIPNNKGCKTEYQTLKNLILASPTVQSVCISGNTPMCDTWGTTVYFEGQDASEKTHVRPNPANSDFLDTYSIQLLKGRNFYENFRADQNSIIINETAVKASGWPDDPIGKWIHIWGRKRTIIGVVRDFHDNDQHSRIRPYVIMPNDENMGNENYLTFKIDPRSGEEAFRHIRSVLNSVYPNTILNLVPYEDLMSKTAMRIWTNIRNTIGFFTIIAVLIAGFGLFALIMFSSQRRIKEIGVRKVQGAKVNNIYGLVLKDFILLLVIANLIALPVPDIMVKTMPGAYKYILKPYEYLIIIGVSLLIAIISGSYYAIRAAGFNPVKALRYE